MPEEGYISDPIKYEYKLEVGFKYEHMRKMEPVDSQTGIMTVYYSDDEQGQAHDNYQFWMESGLCETVALSMRPEVAWRLTGQFDDRYWNTDGTEKKGE